MEENAVQTLGNGQVFFDYGPVSMVVSAVRGGKPDEELCRSAFPAVEACLRDLSGVLDILRRFPADVDPSCLQGTALKMAEAVLAARDPHLTPMAAVAGSIADLVADYLAGQGAEKATANNGGDIALRLAAGESLVLGVLYDLSRPQGIDRTLRLEAGSGIGGVATSGLGGRSLTTGIASGVTVFSERCAQADALATLLADRSFLDLPSVHRVRAGELDPDSDIADLMAVTGVDPLTASEKARALDQVLAEADLQHGRGLMKACIATVQHMTASYDPEGILQDQ